MNLLAKKDRRPHNRVCHFKRKRSWQAFDAFVITISMVLILSAWQLEFGHDMPISVFLLLGLLRGSLQGPLQAGPGYMFFLPCMGPCKGSCFACMD